MRLRMYKITKGRYFSNEEIFMSAKQHKLVSLVLIMLFLPFLMILS